MTTSVYRFQTASTDVVSGGQDWTDPNNAREDESLSGNPSLYATCQITFVDEDESYWIKVTNPTLVSGVAIPSGATITGVRVRHKGYFTSSGTFGHDGQYGLRTNGVQLIVGGSAAGTNYDPDRLWSYNTETTDTYQPSADPLWGQTLSVAQVTASDFGCRLRVYADQDNGIPDPGGNSFTALLNYLYVWIDHEGGETPVQKLLTTSVPGGNGSLSPSGSNYYDVGTVVNIEATPDANYDTRSWTKGVIGSSSAPVGFSDAGSPGDANPDTFSVTMDDNYEVTAEFELYYTLTTAVSPGGGGTVSPANGSKHWRGTVTLNAFANVGYTFANWSGDISTTDNPAFLPMNANKSVQANFTLDNYTVTLSINGEGEVALSPTGTPTGPFDQTETPVGISIVPGTGETFTATPAANWSFVAWIYQIGAAAPVASFSNPVGPLTISANTTISANFVFDGWTLTVNIVGNGTVALDPPGGVYSDGTVVELTATAASGWTFVGWGQDLSGSVNPETILMNSNKVVYAYFEGSGGESSADCRPDRNRWSCDS